MAKLRSDQVATPEQMRGLRFLRPDGRPDRKAARAWVRRQVERVPSRMMLAPGWWRSEAEGWSAKRWFLEYCKDWRELARGELAIWDVRMGRYQPVARPEDYLPLGQGSGWRT